MDLLGHLALGFGVAFTLQNLSCAAVGALLGTLIRVLPGFQPVTTVTTIALLLPLIHALDATPALILLGGIYYGAHARYGGAFFVAWVGAVVVVVAALAPRLTALVAQFGPTDSFALLVFGLIGAVVLAPGSLLKALAMMLLGLLLALIHTDTAGVGDLISGAPHYSLDIAELSGGVSFIVIAIGVFGFGDIIATLGQPAEERGLSATKPDVPPAWPAVLRGTALGAVLILGIPLNAAMALLVGAMSIKGIEPGPQVIVSHPPLFWGLIVSIWVGSVMLGLLSRLLKFPPIGSWVRRLTRPNHSCYVFPALTLLGCIGVYTLHHNSFDVYLAAGFALVGYLFHSLRCEVAPLLLGFILAPRMEENLRHALLLSDGDWSGFITRPWSAALLGGAVLMVVLVMLPAILKKRGAAFQEE